MSNCYRLHPNNIKELLKQPETGMGYQKVSGEINNRFTKLWVYNGEYALDLGSFNTAIDNLLKKGKMKWVFHQAIQLGEIKLTLVRTYESSLEVKEPSQAAVDNRKEKSNADELFVRLSAFEDDKRIDKRNERLLPGSYSTTASDALRCKTKNDNPNERYALPNELKIEWAFYIQPKPSDELQRGIAQPTPGKRGGGREVYFENGTSNSTFIMQNTW